MLYGSSDLQGKSKLEQQIKNTVQYMTARKRQQASVSSIKQDYQVMDPTQDSTRVTHIDVTQSPGRDNKNFKDYPDVTQSQLSIATFQNNNINVVSPAQSNFPLNFVAKKASNYMCTDNYDAYQQPVKLWKDRNAPRTSQMNKRK